MPTHDEARAIEPDLPSEPASDTSGLPSRRRFLGLGAAATAVAAVGTAMAGAGVAGAQASRSGPKSFPKTPAGTPRDASADWKDPLLRLVRRITMGLSPEEVALARSLGYTRYLEYHLNPAGIDDTAIDTLVATRLPTTVMTATGLAAQDANEVEAQLRESALYRAAFSKRQLKERMVEFWTDHFTISIQKVGIAKVADDRDVIRPYAMATFPQLLRATSESPAMLVYLDQNRSSTPTPNQNYAREIMELHTLGVDGGYTQNDVAELSRILTGWSSNATAFVFNRNSHDRNAKTFMGRAFPAMPSTATTTEMKGEGDTAITMLVNNDSTASYIAWKMSRWLLAYDPPQAVVDAVAATYKSTGGSIPAMIRTILTPANLMASPAKYKRPFHFAASAMRGMGATVTNIRGLRQAADVMGMPTFRWEQPNGYPDRIDWWSGLALNRWSFTATLSNLNSATTTMVSTAPFGWLTAATTSTDNVVNQINARMFGGEMPTSLRIALLTYLRGVTPLTDGRVRETIGLAAASNQFQWY